MPKKNLTIEEVKKAKIQLEKDILKLVKDFESDNGVRITYVSLDRKGDTETPAELERGPIVDVNANMELDLVY